jgi:hypothetical protein
MAPRERQKLPRQCSAPCGSLLDRVDGARDRWIVAQSPQESLGLAAHHHQKIVEVVRDTPLAQTAAR